jgi:hypothetical protein
MFVIRSAFARAKYTWGLSVPVPAYLSVRSRRLDLASENRSVPSLVILSVA